MHVDNECSSPLNLIRELKNRYPNSHFLALGQTVFWDEPMKAVFLQLIQEDPQTKMFLGVHDTDYFAKSPVVVTGTNRFVMMPHNDGATQSLWSAAGEVSTLFGSETFPSRHDFAEHGVPLKRLAKLWQDGPQDFINQFTEAWGWRGLVYSGSSNIIVSELRLQDVAEGMIQALDWAFKGAVSFIAPGCCHDEASRISQTILSWCTEYTGWYPNNTLSDLFQYVLPKIYAVLLGYAPANVEVTATSKLLLLTPETASLPRFKFVNHFLNPATCELAVAAYNRAVSDGEMYTLERFGAGALPFDCVVPGRGRGTLRITERVLFIETPKPVAIPITTPLVNVSDLASLLSTQFPEGVTLVGKAVSLVSMLAQEFFFLFSEEGSMYVHRTRMMNDILTANGIKLDMRPIIRLRYQTWDSLEVASSSIQLPEHLASVFSQKVIPSSEFSTRWKEIIQNQKSLCDDVKAIRKPRELLHYFGNKYPQDEWSELLAEYNTLLNRITQIQTEAGEVKKSMQVTYDELKQLNSLCEQTEKAMGEHFRSISDWNSQEEFTRNQYQLQLDEISQQRRVLKSRLKSCNFKRAELENGSTIASIRARKASIEVHAEMFRLQLIRNGLLSIHGLPHTDHRPSAWWLPMVDPKGKWFQKIAETVQIYTEPLIS